MGIFDVPAGMLIEEVAKELKGKIQQPEIFTYVKTGAHKERAPNNPDWFFVRNASILYQIYKHGSTGTGSLRTYYGGRKNRGVKPEAKRKASGKVIRVCLQQLEKHGLLKKEKKGRIVTGQGEKLLFTKSKEVQKAVDEINKKKVMEKKERMDKIEANVKKRIEEKKAALQKANEEAQKEKEAQNKEAQAKEISSEKKEQPTTKGSPEGKGEKHEPGPEGKKA
ncbi:MAG: 30S ribosomal protein S19e [archaeon]|nr:30S ribosomal protein S19e [archaeon]